ncbi:hypothetical protein BJF80_15840 [Serinicoccus sp. CUA-874]|uniref:hypothetical protein n=1 Tax=Serinicoccus sp. CUA-874 TaxID=1517939 RepID=UPI0009637948|nr:hypothetical protein [Serinicoccus sp. CUA-874]OLT18291.1 hypothetical protein BJF80_15840 [Serinicoccus sp. CUA-874]
MSTPGQATPSASAAAPSQATGSSAAPATPTSPGMAPSAAPASATRTAATAARPSTTPRLLRVLRGVAAAVALLTGVAASGTLSTDGVAATPTALAQEWTATQRASVLVAEADQALAQRVVDGDTDESRAAFERVTTEVSRELGTVRDDGGAPEAWATYLVAAERAGTSVGYSAGEGRDRYGTARQGAADAGQALQRVADQRVDALSGPRSELTGVLGTLATLALLGVLVVLALRTRRIVNVPVLAATAITAGLTYLSVNPGSLPVDYEAQLASPATTATALASVHEARAAQLAESVAPATGGRVPRPPPGRLWRRRTRAATWSPTGSRSPRGTPTARRSRPPRRTSRDWPRLSNSGSTTSSRPSTPRSVRRRSSPPGQRSCSAWSPQPSRGPGSRDACRTTGECCARGCALRERQRRRAGACDAHRR